MASRHSRVLEVDGVCYRWSVTGSGEVGISGAVSWVLISIRGREDAHTIAVADDGAVTVTAEGARGTTGKVRGLRVAAFGPGLTAIVLAVVALAGGLSRLSLVLCLVVLDVAFAVVLLDIRRYGIGRVVPDTRGLGTARRA